MRGLLLLITTCSSCWAADDCLFTAVDLTQELAPSTNYYPDFYPFEVSLENAISETFANASKYVAGDEGGTKVEVPARFREDGYTIGKLFKDRLLFLKACVIDLAEKAAMNDNYQASLQDVDEWQHIFGGFPPRSVVVFDFGWSARYPDGDRYFGKRDTLNHPGISPELADYLGRHGSVVAVGTDAPDVDCGRNNELSTSPSQRVLAAHNKYTVTQLALGRHRLPAVGALITVAPLYMSDASASPARVFAEYCADPEPEVTDPNPPPPAPPQIQYVYVAVPTPTPAPAATQQQSAPSTGIISSEKTQAQPASAAYATSAYSPYTVVSSSGVAGQDAAASQTYQYVLSQSPSGSQQAPTYSPASLAAYSGLSNPASKPASSPASSTTPSLTAAQYLQLAAALAQQEQQQQSSPTLSPSAISQYLNLLSSQLNPQPSSAPSTPRLHKAPPSPHDRASASASRTPQRPHASSPNHVTHDHGPQLVSGHNNHYGHGRPKQPSHHR